MYKKYEIILLHLESGNIHFFPLFLSTGSGFGNITYCFETSMDELYMDGKYICKVFWQVLRFENFALKLSKAKMEDIQFPNQAWRMLCGK